EPAPTLTLTWPLVSSPFPNRHARFSQKCVLEGTSDVLMPCAQLLSRKRCYGGFKRADKAERATPCPRSGFRPMVYPAVPPTARTAALASSRRSATPPFGPGRCARTNDNATGGPLLRPLWRGRLAVAQCPLAVTDSCLWGGGQVSPAQCHKQTQA